MIPVTERASMDSRFAFPNRAGRAPIHCGMSMEFGRPSLRQGSGMFVDYTFEQEQPPVALPPVWRCACGFQLDAQDSRPVGSFATGSASARPPMGLPSQ